MRLAGKAPEAGSDSGLGAVLTRGFAGGPGETPQRREYCVLSVSETGCRGRRQRYHAVSTPAKTAESRFVPVRRVDGASGACQDSRLPRPVGVRTGGPVAQLGARLNGIQEVGGSIPPRSTNFLLSPMSHSPTLAESLGHLSRLLLGSLRDHGGGNLALRLGDDGRLLWRLPAEAWDESAHGTALGALGAWTVADREQALGPQVELTVDLGERSGDFQSPDVLLMLRRVAEEHPDLSFRLELPAGVRDIQRARSGLDSRPPGS